MYSEGEELCSHSSYGRPSHSLWLSHEAREISELANHSRFPTWRHCLLEVGYQTSEHNLKYHTYCTVCIYAVFNSLVLWHLPVCLSQIPQEFVDFLKLMGVLLCK